MKISIITACYNSEETIRETVESVLSQNYDNYEHIIIDGKSKDTTLKIIEEYKDKYKGRLKIISEKDKGLYDAMNKGIKNATGDIIGILNSDDKYANKTVLKDIATALKNKTVDGVYSDLEFRDHETMKVITRIWISKTGKYQLGWHPPHPTLYLRKEVYERLGNFNLDYPISADNDFMIRMMKNKTKLEYIPKVLIHMRSGGVSTNGLKGYIRSLKETYRVLKDNNLAFPSVVCGIRICKTILQMINSKFIKNNSGGKNGKTR